MGEKAAMEADGALIEQGASVAGRAGRRQAVAEQQGQVCQAHLRARSRAEDTGCVIRGNPDAEIQVGGVNDRRSSAGNPRLWSLSDGPKSAAAHSLMTSSAPVSVRLLSGLKSASPAW